MSFFIKSRKRKPDNKTGLQSKRTKSFEKKETKARPKSFGEEEIESDVESGVDVDPTDNYSSSEEDVETPQEKKLRLAKKYLEQLEAKERENRDDDEDVHKDIISYRLKQDLLDQTGRLQKEVADNYETPSGEDICVLRGHKLAVTCVVISPDTKHLFSGSKDCSIIKWDVENKKKVCTIHGGRKGTEDSHVGHTAHVLCLAISSDGKFLASGDKNKLIHIWDPDTCKLVHTFKGHRDAVSGLTFRKDSHQLFSASHDRSVKIWNLEEMAYVETLFGHQDCITGIDSLTRERAITSGGRDCSVRIWKVIEESQLVFLGHSGSIDCVTLVNDSYFLTGGDDNCLCLWGVMKKKPIMMVKNAHRGPEGCSTETSHENWITSVAAYQNTDLVASGSKDGCIRFWKCTRDFKGLASVFSVPVAGFVNSLQFSQNGKFLVAAVGQEHRLGRWWRIKESKNSIVIINLNMKEKT